MQFKEPSKMDKSDTTALLQFWFSRQEQNIQLAFSFTVWQDSNSEICEAVVSPPHWHGPMNRNRTHRKYKGNAVQSCQAIKDSSLEDELHGDDNDLSSEDDEPLFTARREDVMPPQQATLLVHKPCKIKVDTAPPWRSGQQASAAIGNVPKPVSSNNKEPARSQKKAVKQPSTSLGAVTRRKEVIHACHDQPRGSKCHAPEPVSDMPAKRTRSKTVAPEASLGKHGKK